MKSVLYRLLLLSMLSFAACGQAENKTTAGATANPLVTIPPTPGPYTGFHRPANVGWLPQLGEFKYDVAERLFDRRARDVLAKPDIDPDIYDFTIDDQELMIWVHYSTYRDGTAYVSSVRFYQGRGLSGTA